MDKLKYILYVIVGNFILAFSVYTFVIPFDITVGGATGLSIVLSKITGLNLSLIVLFINILVLPFGYFLAGKDVVIGALLSSLVYPIALSVIEHITFINQISDTILLSALLGGFVGGVGIGLVIKVGASTGGMDIPPIILNRNFRIPINKSMYLIDTVIMLAQIPFSSVNKVVYGIIYAYVMTYTMNKVLCYGIYKLQVSVISQKDEEICDELLKNDYGVTMNHIQTGLEKRNQRSVQTIILSKNIREVQNIINNIDSQAFVTVHEIRDVTGRGFTLEREYK
jgi:uncharacterized membrane-anchored protein YitT (DUF2179 family)